MQHDYDSNTGTSDDTQRQDYLRKKAMVSVDLVKVNIGDNGKRSPYSHPHTVDHYTTNPTLVTLNTKTGW